MRRTRLFALFILLMACKPYAQGPVLSAQEVNDTFGPLTEFMEITPGMTIADVGAGSGAFTVMMATQLEDCLVYIQDIDRTVLDTENVGKIIDHYSEKTDFRQTNTFRIVYGTPVASNLPDHSIDVIFMNAVAHVLDSPTAMFADLKTKLRPTGKIYIRDGFRDLAGEEYCSSKKCGKRLLSLMELDEIMTAAGFKPYKQHPDMDGYPVLGYALN